MADHDHSRTEGPDSAEEGMQFHGWRLLAIIGATIAVLAIISFLVDWAAIAPLEGRVF